MCEKGADGSLINSRVLSCEVLRGKAAPARMARRVSRAAHGSARQHWCCPGTDASSQRHCLLTAPQLRRGLAGHSLGEHLHLPSQMPPENLCLVKMMLIQRMFSCRTLRGVHSVTVYSSVSSCSLFVYLAAFYIPLD